MKKNFTILIFVFSFLSEVGFAQCPTASFPSEAGSSCPQLFVNFSPHYTNVQTGTTYYWDFGDGYYSTDQVPWHVYNFGGIFYPKVIVTNPGGCADTFVIENPLIINGPQIISHNATPSIGIAPLNVSLQVVSNSISYLWDFGDGSPLVNGVVSTINHIYTIPGIYYPEVIVSDATCTYSMIVDTITVLCACPKPTNPFTTILSHTKAKLNWTTQTCALGYKIRIRKVGTTPWTNITIGTNIGFKTINTLTPNTTYEWQVRSICYASPLYQSGFTLMQTFTTPLRLEEESEPQNNFIIFPNPSSNTINISSSSLSGKYSLKIYNLFGQQVKQTEINFSVSERSKVNIESLAAGYYQLMLQNGSDVVSKSFVKE